MVYMLVARNEQLHLNITLIEPRTICPTEKQPGENLSSNGKEKASNITALSYDLKGHAENVEILRTQGQEDQWIGSCNSSLHG